MDMMNMMEMIQSHTFWRFVLAVGSFVVIRLGAFLLKRAAKRSQIRHGLKLARYIALKRLISLVANGIYAIALILIFGIDLRHLWGSFAGVLTVIAVVFFAVWSLVGNILAGLLLFFTAPFKTDDWVELLPDQVEGRVLAINSFFTLLQDADGHFINVPNSLFFQRYIRKRKHGWVPEVTQSNPAPSTVAEGK
jgi:small-conductance mechanosensitive channel